MRAAASPPCRRGRRPRWLRKALARRRARRARLHVPLPALASPSRNRPPTPLRIRAMACLIMTSRRFVKPQPRSFPAFPRAPPSKEPDDALFAPDELASRFNRSRLQVERRPQVAPALASGPLRARPGADLGNGLPLTRRGGWARHQRPAARRRGQGALREPAVDHLRRAGARRRGRGGRRQGARRRGLAAICGGERRGGEDRRHAGDELQEGAAGARRAGHQVRSRHHRQRQLHRQAAGQQPAVSARRDRHRLRCA